MDEEAPGRAALLRQITEHQEAYAILYERNRVLYEELRVASEKLSLALRSLALLSVPTILEEPGGAEPGALRR
jgi:hypothetical protein